MTAPPLPPPAAPPVALAARLHAVTAALAAAATEAEVAAAVLRQGLEATHASCGVLGIIADGGELVLAHRDGHAERAPVALPLTASAPMPAAVRSGVPVLLRDRSAWLDEFAVPPRGEFEAFAAVPLVADGRPVGCVGFGFPDARGFDDVDLDVLLTLAAQGAQALHRAWLHEERAHVAEVLEAELRPRALPAVRDLDVAVRYRPVGRPHHVGGDFYDLFPTPGGWTACIGDVCGKGVEAAVVTGVARTTIRALARTGAAPAAVVEGLNAALLDRAGEQRFCSLVLLRLAEGAGGALVADHVVAGHPPPLVLRGDGRAAWLERTAPLVGIGEEPEVRARRAELRRGDTLVLVTDGVVETRRDGEVFGAERLRAAATTALGGTAAHVADAIEAALAVFDPLPPRDDQAILVLRRT